MRKSYLIHWTHTAAKNSEEFYSGSPILDVWVHTTVQIQSILLIIGDN